MRRVVPLFALAALLPTACRDNQPTPLGLSPGQPASVLSDGSRSGGNPDFFFLPPIAANPTGHANYSAGSFNPNLAPVVKVCRLDTNDFTALEGASCLSGEPAAVITTSDISVADEHYHVVWHARDAGLDPDGVYRLQVFLGTNRLGFADVAVVRSNAEAKSALTNEIIPLNDNRSLPIKFRIESGAAGACQRSPEDCTEASVTSNGGTFLTSTRFAGVTLQPGWASEEALAAGGGTILLTIERVTLTEGQSCHDAEGVTGQLYNELEGCYHYATDPDLGEFGGFQTAGNSVAVCSGLARTPDNSNEDWLLFKSDPGRPIQALHDVSGPPVDCTEFAFYDGLPSNPMLRFASLKWHSLASAVSRVIGVKTAYAWDAGLGGELRLADDFSNISRGRGVQLAKVAGDLQTGAVGERVSVDPTVRITSVHEELHEGEPHYEPVPGAVVTFTALGGNFGFDESEQPITVLQVTTDAAGEASVPWFLGEATNSVVATAATLDPAPNTFTAQLAAPLLSCVGTDAGGDVIDRGFYLSAFPGNSLSRVDLNVSSRPNSEGGEPADAAGVYALSLTVRSDTYDGTILGTATTSVTLDGTLANVVPVSFHFPSVAVTQGSRITFDLNYVSRPEGGDALYEVHTNTETCAIVQTNGTTPPLDTFRRNGIVTSIWGSAPVID